MENEKKIKVVLLEPGKLARATEIDASLAGMQKTVGGLIEPFYPFEEQVCIVCNEESKINGMLATKGHPKRHSAGVHQVILSHIEEHSKKPEEARQRIVELMGDLPRIELFARQKADGWDAWGNEVSCDVALTGGESNVG